MKKGNFMAKFAKAFSAIAFVFAFGATTYTCMFLVHQPKTPEALNRFRKSK